MSYRSCSPCGGSLNPRSNFQSVPRYSEITRKSGGLSTDLDALKSLGIYEDGDAIETRIGESYIQVWMLYPGQADPDSILEVETTDYNPVYHNFHWVLASGYIQEGEPYVPPPIVPPPIAIPGCTDPLATNYNQYATVSDGSCNYSGPSTFYNTEQTYTAVCPNGREGLNDTYVVPAGVFSSVFSQADADAKAQTYAQSSTDISLVCYSYAAITFDAMPSGDLTPIVSYNHETTMSDATDVYVDFQGSYAYLDFDALADGAIATIGGAAFVGDTSFSTGTFVSGQDYASQDFESLTEGVTTTVETGGTAGDGTVFSTGTIV